MFVVCRQFTVLLFSSYRYELPVRALRLVESDGTIRAFCIMESSMIEHLQTLIVEFRYHVKMRLKIVRILFFALLVNL